MSIALKTWIAPHLSVGELLLSGYYRFLFGRDVPLAAELGARIASLERYQRRRDIPISREAWEAQYARAKADSIDLNAIEEHTRYAVIAGFIKLLKPRAFVLDVGCAKGLLLENLDWTDYAKYVGIDISQMAIDEAAKIASRNHFFAQADAQTYKPAERFDVIVFNEVLYYFENPLREIERYENSLSGGGVFVTSLVEKSVRAVAISKWLKRRYVSLLGIKITGKTKSWMIDVFAPAAVFQNRDSLGH